MGTKVKEAPRGIIIEPEQKTKTPTDDVLTLLAGYQLNGHDRVMIDFSSLKPGKLDDNVLGTCLVRLPNQDRITYIIAVPDSIVERAERLKATYWKDVASQREGYRQYVVAGGDSARRIMNQRSG